VPEYRQHPLTGQTVIVAAERGARPHHFDIETEQKDTDAIRSACPFCEGNERRTPGEIEAIRQPGTSPDTTGWQVRVIPNKFPAVCDNHDFTTLQDFQNQFNPEQFASPHDIKFQSVPAFGEHEVLIDTPRHVISVSEMTLQETVNMFRMYLNRILSLRKERRWAYVQIFKNVGVAAGASIPHSHSQLIAIPFLPTSTLTVLRQAELFRNQHGTCFWCEQIKNDLEDTTRIIESTESFTALCPFASRFASEVEIYPKEHESMLESFLQDKKLTEFASLVQRTIYRLEKTVYWIKDRLAYNFVLHIEPYSHPFAENLFHWHLSILPSLARAAGFEWGTGLHINPIPPEQAAQKLRNVKCEE
jgi:UDPglucose--hexose-1-phosphate uridylyltransferase